MEDGIDFTELLSEVLRIYKDANQPGNVVERLMEGVPDLIPPAPFVPHPLCNICHHFEPGLNTSTRKEDFLLSDCPGCSIVLQVLDAVTDIRRPEFTAIELERKEQPRGSWDPKGVLKIRCVQEGKKDPTSIIGNIYDDPFPNKYSVYTPADAGEDAAIPWLGLRDGKDDDYKEMAEDLDNRLLEARTWLWECAKDHRACDRRVEEWPRRVLDIADEPIRLVTSASLPFSETGYACLSYAWGTSANLKTLKHNLEAHMRGIDVSILPRTLSDAVYVCKAMGIQYLWIDALCIIQDDTKDWTDQIPKMSSIYQGAQLVISAQSATNVHQGFLSLTTAKNAPFKRVELPFEMPDGTSRLVKLSIREDQNGSYHNVPAHHSHRPAADSNDAHVPLTTRAWVYQESFLARRILYATASELAFQCSTCTRCECSLTPQQSLSLIRKAVEDDMYDDVKYLMYDELKTLGHIIRAQHLGADKLPPLSRMNLWGDIVSTYTDKQISVFTDRFAAIQGIVEALIGAIPDTFRHEDYLFGLWRPWLVRCMGWNRQGGPPGNAEAVAVLKDVAPSWSWVTAIGQMHYYGTLFDPDAVELVSVMDIEHYRTEASDKVFGAGGCRLELCGLCLPVQMEPAAVFTDDECVPFMLDDCFASFDDDDDAIIEMVADDPTDEGVFERVSHFMPLICFGGDRGDIPSVQGLFLEHVGEDEKGYMSVFKRVGYGYDFGNRVRLPYGNVKRPDHGDQEEFNSMLCFFKLV